MTIVESSSDFELTRHDTPMKMMETCWLGTNKTSYTSPWWANHGLSFVFLAYKWHWDIESALYNFSNISSGAVVPTVGGTGLNEPCAFPYVYGGENYYQCISTRHGRPWCGTTTQYDDDELWGNCLSKLWSKRFLKMYPFTWLFESFWQCIPMIIQVTCIWIS